MLKAEIRKIYMQKRKALSSDEVLLLSEKIFDNFVTYFKPAPHQKVHIFIPIERLKEIDTQIWIDYFLSRSIRVFVPKILGTALISVEISKDTALEINQWGISEPVSDEDPGISDFDYVITPLLYCDQYGNRVGYGKGFYDSFFQKIPSDIKKIGVNYFTPDEMIDDVREDDIALDYLVTPAEVLSFLRG